MFRELRRKKQALNTDECTKVLIEQTRGVLSILADNGYPYGLPLNHWYDPNTNKIYFHGAKAGHKIDSIKVYNKVSYCVHDTGYKEPNDWAYHVKSVVVFGKISIVEDEELIYTICKNLVSKFTDDAYFKKEWDKASQSVCCLELTMDHISGKIVKEA